MRLTKQSLENAALYYLERHATTRAQLRRVLLNKIRRVRDAAPEQVAATQALVDPLIARYAEAGLVNDAVFAESRASSLRRRGGSARAIAGKLAMKGVDRATITETVAIGGRDAEVAAARELCRRKRLGADRKRDISILARAGFRYDVIVEALSR
ncbi:MAG: RecX family transcriptional regulator [Deltaproteobacteria bacterium]|nr:RecX family transcriptional regulator [Deltaproteobacteria bacterium]